MTHPIMEKYINDHRDINTFDDWWDFIYDDFRRICGIIGFDLDNNEPSFSGFWSQGDGASFTGTYSSTQAETAADKIREYAPRDEDLHRIADNLKLLASGVPEFRARIYRHNHRYVHSNTMGVTDLEFEDEVPQEVFSRIEEGIVEHMRQLADWLYGALKEDLEDLSSDEAVWNTLCDSEMVEEHDLLEVEVHMLREPEPYVPMHHMLRMAIDGESEVWRVEFTKGGTVDLLEVRVEDGGKCTHTVVPEPDALPEWIKGRVAVLNMLDGDYPKDHVDGVGRRLTDNVYYVLK